MPTTLGLDLGPNSIGWALIDPDDHRILASGVRVFPEGVDNFDTAKEVSRNEQRRLARQMRRQHHRRAFRKVQIRDALSQVGLMPADPTEQRVLLQTDPYPLRQRALTEELTPHELGRVFYHLNQRRGFLSLRKKDRKDSEVKGMLAEIDDNEAKRIETGAQTIGAWLATKQKAAREDHTQRTEDDHLRNRHLSRKQIEDEFDLIWYRQRQFGHDVLTDQLKYGESGRREYPVKPEPLNGKTALQAFGLHGLIFFQRPITWPASAVGRCELEPRHRRCPRADRHAQRFRMLQEVNNLRYVDPDDGVEKRLTNEQRQLLLGKLVRTRAMTFDQIRKALGFLNTVRFNLERGERSKLQGMITDAILAGKNHVGPDWHKLDERDKDRIVRNLLDANMSDERVEMRLIERYRLTAEQAEGAVEADLPTGHVDYSLKAIDRLLPHLERGFVVMARDEADSALHAAGYLRPDERSTATRDALPSLTNQDCPIPDIANPVVRRALVELRKVVNAIVREFGKPDSIHLEMAREVQQGPQRRKEYNRRIRDREAERDRAAEEIRKLGEKLTRDKITRYLLWQEQAGICPYTGRAIAQTQIFGGATDVDHILPRSQSLDNSQMNKVLVFRDANRQKGQRTVHTWLAGDAPKRYEQVIQRARKLPYPKYRRFSQKEAHLDEFIARQLTDTAYIARITGQYLRCLYDQPHHVLGLKGQLTAELRHHWGLGTILQEMPDSPAWTADADLRPGEKNRADHRHHAIDAIVVALTTRSRLQQLARIRRDGGTETTGEVLPDPWDDFRDDVVESIGRIRVSHRPNRTVGRALHKDNPMGPVDPEEGLWVKRKPVAELSASEVLAVRDGAIQRCIRARLGKAGIEVQTKGGRTGRPQVRYVDSTTGEPARSDAVSQALNDVCMKSGVPVRRVRIAIKNEAVARIRTGAARRTGDPSRIAYVPTDEQHHVAIFKLRVSKARGDGQYVSQLAAARRVSQREELVVRSHPSDPKADFVMSLSTGDMVTAEVDGRQRLMLVSSLVSTQKRVHLVDANDARRQRKDVGMTPNSLMVKAQVRKVTVDPLGRIRWAND